jgi:hypothetical protein
MVRSGKRQEEDTAQEEALHRLCDAVCSNGWTSYDAHMNQVLLLMVYDWRRCIAALLMHSKKAQCETQQK